MAWFVFKLLSPLGQGLSVLIYVIVLMSNSPHDDKCTKIQPQERSGCKKKSGAPFTLLMNKHIHHHSKRFTSGGNPKGK